MFDKTKTHVPIVSIILDGEIPTSEAVFPMGFCSGQGAVDCLMLHRAPEKEKNLEELWAVLEEEAPGPIRHPAAVGK